MTNISPVRRGSLERLQDHFKALPAPIVAFNKSHSGSRLLASLLDGHGVYIGAHLNVSSDALAILPLVEHFVGNYYPDYASLWARENWPKATEDLVVESFERHLEGYDRHSPWGWKLCETTYIVPVIAAIFPQAKFIHLLRDGRDVAFSDHVAPVLPFWRKVYFNEDRISQWRGLSLTNREYDCRSHIYNSLHWINSVEVGRAYGAMLPGRYMEIRYEDLCRDFENASRRVLDFCGLESREQALQRCAATIRLGSIGKFSEQPRRKQAAVMRLVEPTLLSLGYVDTGRRRDFGVRVKELWFAIVRPIVRLARKTFSAKSAAGAG
jgi:Sulfotransferase family